jgi:hypothetical protein
LKNKIDEFLKEDFKYYDENQKKYEEEEIELFFDIFGKISSIMSESNHYFKKRILDYQIELIKREKMAEKT